MYHHPRPSICSLTILLVVAWPQTAPAQELRSFAAIRRIILDPPLSGTEDTHRKVAEIVQPFGEVRYHNPALPEFLQSTPPLAYCTVRTDLPKPRALGLICRNAAGTHIGTLRARQLKELRDLLYSALASGATSGTLPLNQYRYLYVRPTTKQERNPWAGDFVADLLRDTGAWDVVSSRDRVPAGERLLECDVDAGVTWGDVTDPYIVQASARLLLTDRDGGVVRSIVRDCGWPSAHSCLRGVVRLLLDQRQRDEEIHQPPPPEAPRPPRAPIPSATARDSSRGGAHG